MMLIAERVDVWQAYSEYDAIFDWRFVPMTPIHSNTSGRNPVFDRDPADGHIA